jgi:hypothetical protein
LETPLFDFLFARLALTLGSRPQQSGLGQTGRQSHAERSALQRQSSQRDQVRSLLDSMQHMIEAMRPGPLTTERGAGFTSLFASAVD